MNNEFWNFVEVHAKDDVHRLRLATKGKDPGFDVQLAILQIEARRKFATKLKTTLADFPHFLFPSLLSGEQCTSDRLGNYHARLVPEGATVVDLTAGLGIDVLHIAQRAAHVTAVERNPELAEALRYNAAGLSVNNIEVENADCRAAIAQWIAQKKHFDVAFIDPARRDSAGNRVYAISDCEPDVAALLPEIARISDVLIIKASPMLDISASLHALADKPRRVIVLGTATECKELVFVIENKSNEICAKAEIIEAVTVFADSSESAFSFTRGQEQEAPVPDTSVAIAPGNILYEPYPAVMKAGPFKLLAQKFGCHGFVGGTNLFYSDEMLADFPGNRYRVLEALPYASRIIKRLAVRYPAAEVAVRNFKLSAEGLRAKLGVRDAASGIRIYGIKNSAGERILLITQPCRLEERL